jgi:hypothetical protein
VLSSCHPFPVLKQNLDGHRFKFDNKVETIVAQWLITKDADWYQDITGQLIP